MRGTRELDNSTDGRIDILQAFILAVCFVPSFVLCCLPQIYGLFNEESRSFPEWLAGTRAQVGAPKKKPENPVSLLLPGCIIALLALYPLFHVFVKLVLESSWRKPGIIIGGLHDEDRAVYAAKLLNPQLLVVQSQNPETCFDQLRSVLQRRDKEGLLEILSQPSQILLRAAIKGDWFEDLPKDVMFTRREGLDSDPFVKIYYHEMEGKNVDRAEYFMTFTKEEGQWRIDLISYLKQMKKMKKE